VLQLLGSLKSPPAAFGPVDDRKKQAGFEGFDQGMGGSARDGVGAPRCGGCGESSMLETA